MKGLYESQANCNSWSQTSVQNFNTPAALLNLFGSCREPRLGDADTWGEIEGPLLAGGHLDSFAIPVSAPGGRPVFVLALI